MDILGALPALVPIVTGISAGVGGVRFIQESQRGVKLRFGRVLRDRAGRPKIVNPGFVFVLPTVHSLRRIHVRTQTLALSAQRVMLADHTVFTVGALVVTRVIDTDEGIYRALFEVDDVATSVEEYCASALRDVLASIRYRDLEDPDALAARVQATVAERLVAWGVEVEDFKLTDCSPTAETARMILIKTEAQFRLDALSDAAKRLHSEGVALTPSLAATLIGMPVAVALGESGSSADRRSLAPAPGAEPNGSSFTLRVGTSGDDAP